MHFWVFKNDKEQHRVVFLAENEVDLLERREQFEISDDYKLEASVPAAVVWDQWGEAGLDMKVCFESLLRVDDLNDQQPLRRLLEEIFRQGIRINDDEPDFILTPLDE